MKNYEDYEKAFGAVSVNGKKYALTQDAYATGGSFYAPNGRYDGDWYEAAAIDADGGDYRIIWTDVDWQTEDEGNAADWDNPDYIIDA